MILRLGFYGINLMLLFLNKILEVISFFLNKLKPLLVLTLLRFVLIDPLQIQFLESIFKFCLSAWKSKLKIVKFSWKFKHVFLLFFYLWKKLLIYRHLLLSTNFFLFNKILVVFDFLLKFLNCVLFGPEFLLKVTDYVFMSQYFRFFFVDDFFQWDDFFTVLLDFLF